ncbi:MAG: hypothetical protein RLZ56_1147 [Bacteroidota bacterium]|jgi:uncharacterized protein YqgV (UPF0045/DUF77 family)
MHNFIVNGTIQILPLAQDKHPYEWVDDAIEVIMASGIKYEVRPFSTELEGSYSEIIQLFNDVNERLYTMQCNEWICNLQIQIRANEDMTAAEKTAKYDKN